MSERRHIVIAGAGVAALEVLLALRAHELPNLDVHVLAPGDSFLYNPVSVAEAFGLGRAPDFDLATILSEHGATRHADTLASVDLGARTVRTGAGAVLPYDELVLAVGARAAPALPGALTFRGRRDVPALREILRDVEAGRVRRLAFALATDNTWPLPIYELALTAATFASTHGLDVRLVLVSCEEQPLELFGSSASDAIRELLHARGILLRQPALARTFADGVVHLAGGASLLADRVVALPRLRGPSVPGLPRDGAGFIPIDLHGRVRGLEAVYAAGDATAFPLKGGGLAAQQADAIAEMIAHRLGAAVEPRPFSAVIRGLLLTGGEPIHLRAGPGTLRRDATVANERRARWGDHAMALNALDSAEALGGSLPEE